MALEKPGKAGYRRCKAERRRISQVKGQSGRFRRRCVPADGPLFFRSCARSSFLLFKTDFGGEIMEIFDTILGFLKGPLNDFAWMYTFLPCAILGGLFLSATAACSFCTSATP